MYISYTKYIYMNYTLCRIHWIKVARNRYCDGWRIISSININIQNIQIWNVQHKRGTRQYIVTDGSQIHVTPPLTSLIMIEMVTRMMLVSRNMMMMMMMMTMVTRILLGHWRDWAIIFFRNDTICSNFFVFHFAQERGFWQRWWMFRWFRSSVTTICVFYRTNNCLGLTLWAISWNGEKLYFWDDYSSMWGRVHVGLAPWLIAA